MRSEDAERGDAPRWGRSRIILAKGKILDVNTKHAEERENAFEYSCKAREDDTYFTRRPDLDSLGLV